MEITGRKMATLVSETNEVRVRGGGEGGEREEALEVNSLLGL